MGDPSGEHQLMAAVRAAASSLDEVVDLDPLFLSTAEKGQLLVELTRVLGRVAAVRAQVMAVADDVAAEAGSRDAAAWVAAHTRTPRREAVADHALGVRLRHRWQGVGEAAVSGSLTWGQVGVLVRALDALPTDLDPELVAKAEAHLVAEAGHFGPEVLRRLGRHVLEVVAPDLADEHLARALAAEEATARASTRLFLRPRGDGSTDLRVRLPDHVASRLRVYLDAYTSPRRASPDLAGAGDVDRLPLSRRRGEAFCALLEHMPTDGLPVHGGTPTTVMVTLDLQTLQTGLGAGLTGTGETLSAGQARRLACTAGVIPVVLGGPSEILDLGRARRLFSPAQRKALAIRDRGCRAEDCDIPASWCEAHHARDPWIRGGRTDLDDGVLLCAFHHHRAHDPGYTTSRLPNGDVRYRRRR